MELFPKREVLLNDKTLDELHERCNIAKTGIPEHESNPTSIVARLRQLVSFQPSSSNSSVASERFRANETHHVSI